MKGVFARWRKNGHTRTLPFLGGQQSHWLVDFSIFVQNEPKKWAINYITLFNLKKFLKVEFNLVFDETVTITFITYFIFWKLFFILKRIQKLKICTWKKVAIRKWLLVSLGVNCDLIVKPTIYIFLLKMCTF